MTIRRLLSAVGVGAVLALGACDQHPTTSPDDGSDIELRKGKGPGTGSGPNGTVTYSGAITTSGDALILTDNNKKHQTESCCGGTVAQPHTLTFALTGTAAACAGSSSELIDHLNGRAGVATYDVVYRDRRAETGSVKIIYDADGYGPFHLTLSGPMTEGAGLTFSLGSGGGSVRMDWPDGFAAANGLPGIEYCDALADVINVDVDPN